MPNIVTSVTDALTGIANTAGSLAGAYTTVKTAVAPPPVKVSQASAVVPYSPAPTPYIPPTTYIPPGGTIPPSIPSVQQVLDLPFIDIVKQGGGATIDDLTSPFTKGAMQSRGKLHARANPTTGKLTWFRPAGRPILFSGDLSAARRVRKVAMRARRRSGGR